MPLPVTFTLDFEDLRTSPTQESRVEYATSLILDRLAELDIRGTIFCVADVAAEEPQLLRRMTALGHEIAVHGYQHIPIDLLGRQKFHEQTIRAKEMLEDLSGQEVVGFRAPQFSIVPETRWAVDVLAEVGFSYSSSILPVATLMYGWPGTPKTPFLWPQGIVEIPCPVVRFMGVTIPYLGGAYMRVLPSVVRRRGVNSADPSSVLWTYCHPWEFDPDEQFYVYEHGGWLVSRIGWINRGGMLARVERSLRAASGPPLREVAALLTDLEVFDPEDSSNRHVPLQGRLRRKADA